MNIASKVMDAHRPRGGGKRKDRCFRIYLDMPDGATEDEIMDFIEDAVTSHQAKTSWKLNRDTVVVRRLYPQYSECK